MRIHDPRSVIASFKEAVKLVTDNLPTRLKQNPNSDSHRSSWVLRDRALKHVASEFIYDAHGLPEDILTSYNVHFTRNFLDILNPTTIDVPSNIFLADGLNILGWDKYLPKGYRGLAPHSQSQAGLQSEGKRFYEQLKGDGKQVIAIVLADHWLVSEEAERFHKLASSSSNVRFVISSSPRCSRQDFSMFCEYFRSQLSPEGSNSLLTYDFHAEPPDQNPYKALLGLADHMIVVGQSQSMISERLFAGRGVHYAWGHYASVMSKSFGAELMKTEKIKHFTTSNDLITHRFKIIDATDMVSTSLGKEYDTYQQISRQPSADLILNAMKRKMRRGIRAEPKPG